MDEKLTNTGTANTGAANAGAGRSEVSETATGKAAPGKGAGEHSALLRQALRAVEQMTQKLQAAESRAREVSQPIAIVGMGCRYPGGANDPESFWELLREGREAICEVPAERWDAEAYYDPDPTRPGKMVSKYGGFLDAIDQFDAAFFGIAPREAAMMDPQQRLLLEVAWAALDSGGIAPRSLAESKTGVYLGMASEDYGHIQMEAGDAELLDVHYATGNGRSIASGRLAYLLGLRGPAVTLDTACSSSLVAVHLACQSLRLGECELALAGGVNVMLSPETTVALSQAHMLAPDGRCKAFSAEADGFARAEGCGLVVLKTLKQAQADGDRVFAVIRGSAVNQDGASSSLTAPNGPAQEALMRQALRDAGVAAAAIGLVEAHGTGTALGDPIELRALGAVYGAARAAGELLPVSSLKTNFGHMEAAAGVGGLMKLVLAMEHEAIPPHLHMEKPTPHVPWGQLKLTVERSLKEWPRVDGKPRLGAVSSFGYSGTNAHLIVEEAPVGGGRWVLRSAQDDKVVGVDDEVLADELALLSVSAKSEAALRALAASYAERLELGVGGSWAEIAATAGVGRDHFRYRAAIVARDRGEAAERLRELAAGRGSAAARTVPVRTAPAVGFLFTGQGSERAGMGLELLEQSGAFRAAVARLEAVLEGGVENEAAARLGFAEIWANRNGELERARYVQPALYAFDWALSEHWRSWGVTPEVVLGHSLGEYVAATVAGVISPEDGIRLVAVRGRLTEELGKPGGMVAVVASEAEVRGLLDADGELSIAAVNGPSSVVVSGALGAVDLLVERLGREGLRHKRLRTTHGFHSRALDGMLDAFETEAAKISFRAPEMKWVSNLTGRVVERGQPVDARYWRRHLRETVLFSAGLSVAAAASDLLLEVGTEPQLLALADANGVDESRRVASIARAGGEWAGVLRAAGRLYCAGMDLDWRAVAADEAGGRKLRRAALPGYPFERQRFWFTDGRRLKAAGSRPSGVEEQGISSFDREANGHPLLGVRVRMRGDRAVFHGVVSAESPVHLGDHVVMGMRVLPGAAFLEMALAAGRQLEAGTSWDVSEVEFREPCLFDERRLLETVVLAAESADGRRRFEIASAAPESDEWTLHVTGWLEVAEPAADMPLDLMAMKDRLSTVWDGETLYERLSLAGLGFGPAFRTIAQAWGSAQESLVELAFLPEVGADAVRYGVHPVALDACLQAAAALMEAEQPAAPALPASVERLRVWGDPAKLRFATAKVRRRLGRAATVEILGFDAEGNGVLAADGLTLVEMRTAAPEDEWRGWVQEVVWDEAALTEATQEGGRCDVLIVSGGTSTLAGMLEGVAVEAGAAVTVVSSEAKAEGALGVWLAGLKAGRKPGTLDRKPEIFYLPGAESVVGPEDSALGWQERVLGGALLWTQALIAAERLGQCRLWLVSRGAPGPDASPVAVAADGATLEAFGRSVRSEDGDAEAIAVDLEADGRADVELLWRMGSSAVALGPRYALRGGKVWTPRFAQRALARREDGDETRRLYFAESGLMEDLKPRREARREPVGGEVEIAVAATAINFHEVLSALNPAHAGGLAPGGECSGMVVRVGPEVADLSVGDEVVAVTAGLMADYATTTRERVWKKPAGLSMEEAATVPIAFLTARWCLERVARTQPGEWVLVHAGAGGVGMASIQEAQRLGARVLATAGSEAKRAMLREMGVEGVFDSRSILHAGNFAEGVLEATGGRGVDVLLNSLAGDKVTAGLRVMAPGGRFIELGEQTVLSAEERAGLRSDIRYEVVQLRDELAVPTPESLETIASVLKDFEAGKFKPLSWRRFALDQVGDAFRLMAAGLHTGRVLIVPRIEDETKRTVAKFAGFRRDGAYVVTGAFGGLGLLMVEWLAKQGAGCVLALGRSTASAETEARLAELRAAGTDVVAVRCDVGDKASLAEASLAVPNGYALRGVFHCAGVWANGALTNQTAELYREALAPKVEGGWNLHRLTLGAELDCFVLFSSVAGPMGSRGQSNYAAANAYLDGLAHYRREELGLTALSVDWGAWSGAGASVRHGMVERSEKAGAVAITPEKGFALLGRLLEEDCAQVMVSKVDWKKWAGFFQAEYAANADLLAGLMPVSGTGATGKGDAGSDGWLGRWMALPAAKRRAQLAARVEDRVRGILGLGSKAAIDETRPLQEYGLDSLLAIELRNALSADLEAKLPQTALFDYPTMGGLTEWLFADVLRAGGEETERVEEAQPEAQTGSGEAVLAGVEELSDEEVERLFQEKMAGTGR